MGALSNDQSMEEILSSIKRIIADEDSARASGTPRVARRKPVAKPVIEPDTNAEDDQILELTDAIAAEPAQPAPVAAEPAARAAESVAQPAAKAPTHTSSKTAAAQESETMAKQPIANAGAATANDAPVISDSSAASVRESLSNLSALLIKPVAEAPSNTLEGLVQEMLRPMLKEWLDANLPGLVETMVKHEIEKITGRV